MAHQTEVFSLEPSSIELIEKILNARYRNLGQQNSRTISEFSGGNSRIAIALAETIGNDENISTLKDEELFRRLFHQRHDKEKSLEKTAQTNASRISQCDNNYCLWNTELMIPILLKLWGCLSTKTLKSVPYFCVTCKLNLKGSVYKTETTKRQ